MATLLAPLIALAVLAVGAAALGVQRSFQRRLVGTSLVGTASAGATRSLPDILYFTGASCTVCHVAQRPALARLRELIADVDIREIDVADDPQTARAYRVMTLPTTVVLDPQGTMTAVNAGFSSESMLSEQVVAARRSVPQPAVA